jgi:hypothetical protein
MPMLEASVQGFVSILTATVMIYMTAGVLWGLLIGILPALGGITAMVLLLPFAVVVEPEAGIALLLGAHIGTIYGDAACSILGKGDSPLLRRLPYDPEGAGGQSPGSMRDLGFHRGDHRGCRPDYHPSLYASFHACPGPAGVLHDGGVGALGHRRLR